MKYISLLIRANSHCFWIIERIFQFYMAQFRTSKDGQPIYFYKAKTVRVCACAKTHNFSSIEKIGVLKWNIFLLIRANSHCFWKIERIFQFYIAQFRTSKDGRPIYFYKAKTVRVCACANTHNFSSIEKIES